MPSSPSRSSLASYPLAKKTHSPPSWGVRFVERPQSWHFVQCLHSKRSTLFGLKFSVDCKIKDSKKVSRKEKSRKPLSSKKETCESPHFFMSAFNRCVFLWSLATTRSTASSRSSTANCSAILSQSSFSSVVMRLFLLVLGFCVSSLHFSQWVCCKNVKCAPKGVQHTAEV